MTSRDFERFAANQVLAAEGTTSPKEAVVRDICAEHGVEFVGLRRAHTASGNKLKSHDLFVKASADLEDRKNEIRTAAEAAGVTLRTIEAIGGGNTVLAEDAEPRMSAADMKALRKRIGMSQEAFAEALGIGKNSVNRYEGGTPIPKNVALACSAVACNLGPWPIKPDA